jgi:hypothetical protein
MRPLAKNLIRPEIIEEILKESTHDDSVIGFLLDCRKSSLKRSGLLDRPASVMTLDKLLVGKANLFYVDPRSYSEGDGTRSESYDGAVREFATSLMSCGAVKFEMSYPCIILMQHRGGTLSNINSLTLDSRAMCMYFWDVYGFVADFLGKDTECKLSSAFDSEDDGVRGVIKKHAGSIGLEALKSSICILCGKMIDVL